MADEKPDGQRVVIINSKKRVFDGFFKIDEAVLTYSRLDGGAPWRNVRRLVFERGDSAAAVVHDTERDVVVLTEQFRFPTHAKDPPGWLVEVMAGSVDREETPEQCLRRELREELGYTVETLTPISSFYVSPGGSSERVHLFYAPVNPAMLTNPGASGNASEDEDIARVEVPRARFVEDVAAGRYLDAKTMIAGLWMKLSLGG